MTEETKLARTDETALVLYGDRQDVKELAFRIEKFLPATKELPDAGRLALAQVAMSMGLNPFLGEIWAIPKKDYKTGQVVGWDIMAGIKGLRRAARRTKIPFVVTFRNPTTEEAQEWGLQAGDIGKVAQLYRVTHAEQTIYKLTGKWPMIEGVGIYKNGEKTKMQPIQVARKRAEADALKQGFDLPVAFDDEGYSADEIQPPGEWAGHREPGGSLQELFGPEDADEDDENGGFVEEMAIETEAIPTATTIDVDAATGEIAPPKPLTESPALKLDRPGALKRVNQLQAKVYELTGDFSAPHLRNHLLKHYGVESLSKLTDEQIIAFGQHLRQLVVDAEAKLAASSTPAEDSNPADVVSTAEGV